MQLPCIWLLIGSRYRKTLFMHVKCDQVELNRASTCILAHLREERKYQRKEDEEDEDVDWRYLGFCLFLGGFANETKWLLSTSTRREFLLAYAVVISPFVSKSMFNFVSGSFVFERWVLQSTTSGCESGSWMLAGEQLKEFCRYEASKIASSSSVIMSSSSTLGSFLSSFCLLMTLCMFMCVSERRKYVKL